MRKAIVFASLLAAVFFSTVLVSTIPLAAQVSINTTLTTGTMTGGIANAYRTAYLHFQLVNCGDNIPVIPGQPSVVAQDAFDLYPVTPGSAIVGSILGNDQMTCGNVISTYYVVTPMKDASHPLRGGIPYVICSASATITTCGNQASLGTFNLVTADPMTQPPPTPGFSQLYENPTNTQTWNQPAGTTGNFIGSFLCSPTDGLGPCTFDFTGATIIGLPGATPTTVVGTPNQVNVTTVGSTATVSLPSPITLPPVNGPLTIGPSTPPGVSAVLFNQEDPFCLLNPLGYDQLCDQVDLATGSSALSWDPNGLANQRVYTTAFQSVPYVDGNIMCYSAATGMPITCPNFTVNSQNGIETAPAVGISVPTDTGTANAYVACPVGVSAPTVSLSVGLMAYFVALHANTGASTLNWCTTGIQPIKKISSSGLAALLANDINVAPFIVKAVWDGTEWDDIEPGTVSASGGGTVNSATIHQLGIYNASGNTISGDANLTDNGTTLTYGSGSGDVSAATFNHKAMVGTDAGIATAATISTTALNPACSTANGGLSTTNCPPPIPYALDSGSGGNVVITVQGLPASIATGLCVNFKTASAGNATSTLNVTPYTGATAYGAINLYKRTEAGVAALAATGVDMTSGGVFEACYDGTEWVLNTPSSTAYVTGSLPTDCLALGNSTNQLQGCVPSSYRLDQTGVSTANSGSPQTVASSVSAGHYQFNVYADQSAGCTTVGSGVLTISVGWTDGTHARVGATLTLTPGTAATGTGSYVNQVNDVYVGSSSNLTLTATYTACTTGTWTYDVHAYAVRMY
jgi:hypothetical protein